MKKALLTMTLAGAALVGGCRSGSSNPLIGHWTSTTDPNATGAAGCSTGFTFTSDTKTNFWKGQQSNALVSYVVKPGEVFVVADGGSVGYRFMTPDTMMMDAGYENCTYKRD